MIWSYEHSNQVGRFWLCDSAFGKHCCDALKCMAGEFIIQFSEWSLKNMHLTCCGKVGSISKSKRMISGSNISRNRKSNEKLDDLRQKIRGWSQRNLKCLRVMKTNTSFCCCEKIYAVMNKAFEWTKVQQSSLLCA